MGLAAVLSAWTAALLLGTFVEYVAHRAMHAGKFLRKRHARHHRNKTGQGWLGEFRDYFLPSCPVAFIGLVLLPQQAGMAFAVGVVTYAALAAWSHQLQHEDPELVFWMKQPVHHLHHAHNMWHHNFGILVDFWDHVFGTYKAPEPQVQHRSGWRELLTIRWF